MTLPRHIHLDAVGGVAGDMFVAALLDALPNLRARVFADLAAVRPPGMADSVLREGMSGGIAVLRFGLDDHAQGGPHHGHDHDHGHGTSFATLSHRIRSASLQPGSAEQAIAILRRMAEAESAIHRVAVQDVHFHELGDWDSLLDVVAAGSIAATLTDCSWSVSDLPRGSGLVRTQHGLLPVPAPAAAALLRGFAWRDDGIGGERVTPTGAAIVAHLVTQPGLPSGSVLLATGTGAGTRELKGMPNVLRASVFTTAEADMQSDEVTVISFDVDDMTGEEVGVAADRLRAAEGVLDLSTGNWFGKKGRPVTEVRLLVRPAAFRTVAELCFRETSTLGLRWRNERRLLLVRSADRVEVDGQSLRRKSARRPGGEVTSKIESDDVAGTEGLAMRRKLRARGEREKPQ